MREVQAEADLQSITSGHMRLRRNFIGCTAFSFVILWSQRQLLVLNPATLVVQVVWTNFEGGLEPSLAGYADIWLAGNDRHLLAPFTA